MPLLPQAVRAKLEGREIGVATLVEMSFRSGVALVWTGRGDLQAAGATWKGVGDLVRISDVTPIVDLSAAQLTLTLSGDMPEMLRIIELSASGMEEVEGRYIRLWMQFFDVSGGAFARLDEPVIAFVGTMRNIRWVLEGAGMFHASLISESPFVGRRQAANGLLTDAEQKRRFPGDKGLEFVSTVAEQRPLWPTF